jgi:hypothetical protein
MEIFKELKKLGYIHYSATTIEELDDLPLNSAERISEQALVLRWFREKYDLHYKIEPTIKNKYVSYVSKIGWEFVDMVNTYEKAELECLKKLIEIVKEKLNEQD